MAGGHHGGVRQCLRQPCSRSPTAAGLPRWPDTDHAGLTWPRSVACGSSGSGPVSGGALHELPCPRGCAKPTPAGRAGDRWKGGGRTPVRGVSRRGDQHGRVCQTPAVRPEVVPEVADGQSTDRSLCCGEGTWSWSTSGRMSWTSTVAVCWAPRLLPGSVAGRPGDRGRRRGPRTRMGLEVCAEEGGCGPALLQVSQAEHAWGEVLKITIRRCRTTQPIGAHTAMLVAR
jgi:hypothetical protein